MNREVNKKSALRIRFGALDAALLLLLVLTVFSLWQKQTLRILFDRQRDEAAYTVAFTAESVPHSDLSHFTDGAVVYLVDSGEERIFLGTFSGTPQWVAELREVTDEAGNSVEVPYPEEDTERPVTLFGALSCRGGLRDGLLVLQGGTMLTLGDTFFVATEKGEYRITVDSFTKMP